MLLLIRRKPAILLFALLLSVTAAWSQTSNQSGAITGSVRDQTGASVPNAKVTVTSPHGLSSEKTTGPDGLFTFPLLPPGTYSLTAEANGFSKYVLNDIKVEV